MNNLRLLLFQKFQYKLVLFQCVFINYSTVIGYMLNIHIFKNYLNFNFFH